MAHSGKMGRVTGRWSQLNRDLLGVCHRTLVSSKIGHNSSGLGTSYPLGFLTKERRNSTTSHISCNLKHYNRSMSVDADSNTIILKRIGVDTCRQKIGGRQWSHPLT
jgi:hypothetical protein